MQINNIITLKTNTIVLKTSTFVKNINFHFKYMISLQQALFVQLLLMKIFLSHIFHLFLRCLIFVNI